MERLEGIFEVFLEIKIRKGKRWNIFTEAFLYFCNYIEDYHNGFMKIDHEDLDHKERLLIRINNQLIY